MNLELFISFIVAIIAATYLVRAIDVCLYRLLIVLRVTLRNWASRLTGAACFLILIGAFCMTPQYKAQAAAMVCTNCSTNLVQMLEYATGIKDLAYQAEGLVETYTQTAQQIQMVKQQIEQLEVMYKNIKQLPEQARQLLSGDLNRLAGLTGQLETYRGDMSSLGRIFNQFFPGQSEFEAWDNPTYQAKWDEWSQAVDAASRATFQLSGSQLKELQDSGKMQDHINELLNTPEGQMQAMQAGNNLAALQIQEARQLRELMATTIQAEAISREKKEKEDQKRMEEWRKATNYKGKGIDEITNRKF